ncbi:hypothetical protein FRB91_004107 [Serendipita sp. 411]|nr:hypothetical protein FRB91_004107 [Serendipita sp. 411]
MSSSNSNASNTFQTPDMVSKIAYITPKSLSRRTEPDPVDRFDQENAEPSLETGSASPTRASRLDTPFAKIFSPLRRVPSSRQPFLCSKPNSLRFRGDDLVQDLARSVQPSVIKDSHTEIYEPFLFNPITNLFDEGKTPVMSKKELSRARRSGSAASPTITRSSPVKRVPSIVSPKSRRSGPRYSSSTTHCSSDRSEGDPVQDLARQLEVPAVKSPPPSPKEAKPSASVPAAVASPTENGDGSALSATPKPGSEGSTSDLALLTDKPQPSEDASKSEEPSPLPEKETSPSRRCKRKLMDDDDETEEEEIRTNINKRWKSDLEIFDRKATLQENVYDLESLLGGADEFYSFDNINEIWVTQEEELNDVDDPSNWGNDRTSTIESILPYSLKWNECKSQTSTAAAPLSADELYIKACTKLREYKALVDSRANVDAQCKARDEMAEAWRRWRHQSSDFVTIGDLKRYGEVLDMEGRQAIADALEVESSLLQAWVEEPFLRETRERKRKEGKAASTLKARATDSTPQPIDFSLYVNFGNDEEDIKSLNRTNAYPLSNLPFILPPPPPPTVTTLAAIPIVAQAIPTLSLAKMGQGGAVLQQLFVAETMDGGSSQGAGAEVRRAGRQKGMAAERALWSTSERPHPKREEDQRLDKGVQRSS